jgi:hypothetical protein
MMSELLKINVNEHTEKKGQLTYLSWAWAWAEVLKNDPAATWGVVLYGDKPCMMIGDTAMVHTWVTIKGIRRECLLPCMDHKNNAIKNPDARKISDTIMRCMTKACAMHGLGLYIYAGEDLPPEDDADKERQRRDWIEERKTWIMCAKNSGELKEILREALAVTEQMGDDAAADELRAAAMDKTAQARSKNDAAQAT